MNAGGQEEPAELDDAQALKLAIPWVLGSGAVVTFLAWLLDLAIDSDVLPFANGERGVVLVMAIALDGPWSRDRCLGGQPDSDPNAWESSLP